MRSIVAAGALALLLALPSQVRAECPAAGEGVLVEGTQLRVASAIAFDLYGPAIDPASLPVIDAVARRMRDCLELQIEIQVHTDTRRMGVFNARQSLAIALLIRDRLIAQGVAAHRVIACGYGESRPVVEPGREPWDPRNNRVEFVRVPDARAARCPPIEG